MFYIQAVLTNFSEKPSLFFRKVHIVNCNKLYTAIHQPDL